MAIEIPPDARPGDRWQTSDERGLQEATLEPSGAVRFSLIEPSEALAAEREQARGAGRRARPDVRGYLVAVFATLGKREARTIVRDYPDMVIGLEAGDWAMARAALGDMLEDGAISEMEYGALQSLIEAHHIPAWGG